MKILTQIKAMQKLSREWRRAGEGVALVPTLGGLHAGHLSLVAIACRHADRVVVSIYLNPTQFGPAEDLAAYPCDSAADERLCAEAGADAIFRPDDSEMYLPGASTWVTEAALTLPLCGQSRPHHFRGVTTVVAKLFLAAFPDIAVFGQKDAQQALVIRRMTRDLNFPTEIIVGPTVREADGLAVSSRNTYLSAAERGAATGIHRGLKRAAEAFKAGERDAFVLVGSVRREIVESGGRVDYIECRRNDDLREVTRIEEAALLAVAAFYGKARLIDNVVLTP